MTNVRRYDRQNLITGWDQERLTQAVVTIIGSDATAQYIALPLAALGVGTIRIIDPEKGTAKDTLLDIPLQGPSRAKTLEDALEKINPDIHVTGIQSSLEARQAAYFLTGSDVIIDATNNMRSKTLALEYAQRTGTPFISAGADATSAKAVSGEHAGPLVLLPQYQGKEQSRLTSLELGGVVAEEVKKILMHGLGILPQPYTFNLESLTRFSWKKDQEVRPDPAAFKDKNVLIVGAGALGCFLGPALAENLDLALIDIMDYDTVEEHNLNRQVAFYDAVGRLKAERLAETLEKMVVGDTRVRGRAEKFTEDMQLDAHYNLILDAVDSFYTKAVLHNFAKQHGIPIISGGTDYRAATVLVYKPGETACFDCQINLSELAKRQELIRRTSCLISPDASVIMTNQIAAALMIAEAQAVLRPDIYGRPVNGEIKYLSDSDLKGGITVREGACTCGPADITIPDLTRVTFEEKEVDGLLIKEIYVDGEKI